MVRDEDNEISSHSPLNEHNYSSALPAVTTPRPRGRPPKSRNDTQSTITRSSPVRKEMFSSSEDSDYADNEEPIQIINITDSETVKRKRGRPKKIISIADVVSSRMFHDGDASASAASFSDYELRTKKKMKKKVKVVLTPSGKRRGRPPKDSSKSDSEVVKKKRGRPRKSVATVLTYQPTMNSSVDDDDEDDMMYISAASAGTAHSTEDSAQQKPRAKRGRPRKSVATVLTYQPTMNSLVGDDDEDDMMYSSAASADVATPAVDSAQQQPRAKRGRPRKSATVLPSPGSGSSDSDRSSDRDRSYHPDKKIFSTRLITKSKIIRDPDYVSSDFTPLMSPAGSQFGSRSSTTQTIVNGEAVVVVKRGRGRPPKVPKIVGVRRHTIGGTLEPRRTLSTTTTTSTTSSGAQVSRLVVRIPAVPTPKRTQSSPNSSAVPIQPPTITVKKLAAEPKTEKKLLAEPKTDNKMAPERKMMPKTEKTDKEKKSSLTRADENLDSSINSTATEGSVRRKRGRPRKNDPTAPSNQTPIQKPAVSNEASSFAKKRGRPSRSETRLASARARQQSPGLSLSPGPALKRQFTIPLEEKRPLPSIDREGAIGEWTDFYDGVPDTEVASFHHQLRRFAIMLTEVESRFTRGSSPRS